MAQIKIYTKASCPACIMAKEILGKKGASFEEVALDNKPLELEALKKRTKMNTVPQIFINGELIGGCSDMMELDRKGALDPLLKASL